MITYLLPARRQLENRMSLWASVYGIWILFWNIISSNEINPIVWTGLSINNSLWVAVLLIIGGALHWHGVKLNGAHRWSPAWRFVGLSLITITWFTIFLYVPTFSSSATLVYGVFAYYFIKVTFSAFSDLVTACGGTEYGRAKTSA